MIWRYIRYLCLFILLAFDYLFLRFNVLDVTGFWLPILLVAGICISLFYSSEEASNKTERIISLTILIALSICFGLLKIW